MLAAATSSRRRRFTSSSASSKLANVISVLHRSQSMAGPPLILLAEFMMDALLQPRGNPAGVSRTRAAERTRLQNSGRVTFCPGMRPVRSTVIMARSRRGPLRDIMGAPRPRTR
jgi:hypothetical protein